MPQVNYDALTINKLFGNKLTKQELDYIIKRVKQGEEAILKDEMVMIHDPPDDCVNEGYYHLKFVSAARINTRLRLDFVDRDGKRFKLGISAIEQENVKNTYRGDSFILKIKNNNILEVIKNVTKNIRFRI